MFIRLLFLAFFGSLTVFAEENIKLIGETSFNEETRSGVVLVDFYGPWCGPCQKLTPVLEKIAEKMKGKVKIVKVNIDQSRALMEAQNVQGVPTLILFKNGKEQGRLVGYRDQEAIEKFIISSS